MLSEEDDVSDALTPPDDTIDPLIGGINAEYSLRGVITRDDIDHTLHLLMADANLFDLQVDSTLPPSENNNSVGGDGNTTVFNESLSASNSSTRDVSRTSTLNVLGDISNTSSTISLDPTSTSKQESTPRRRKKQSRIPSFLMLDDLQPRRDKTIKKRGAKLCEHERSKDMGYLRNGGFAMTCGACDQALKICLNCNTWTGYGYVFLSLLVYIYTGMGFLSDFHTLHTLYNRNFDRHFKYPEFSDCVHPGNMSNNFDTYGLKPYKFKVKEADNDCADENEKKKTTNSKRSKA